MSAMLRCTIAHCGNVITSLTVSFYSAPSSAPLITEVKMSVRNFARLIIVSSALALAACAGLPATDTFNTPVWDSPAN
jgi:hypothetical protein